MTDQQRQQRANQAGYQERPRVSMAWKVAGHLLRQLKVTRPFFAHQALQHLQQLNALRFAGGAATGSTAGNGCYGVMGRAGCGALPWGSLQHPCLAEYSSLHGSGKGQRRL
jgi:hypothetical protein